MLSKTKSKIKNIDIERIFNQYFKSNRVMDISELKDGCFNISYLVKLENNMEYVLKVSPSDDVEVLTYEQDIMVTEVNFHVVVQKHLPIPVPEIIYSDFSRKIIPHNYFIMSKLNGEALDKYGELSNKQRKIVYKSLAKYIAYIHNLTGDHFGYIPLSDNFLGKNYFDSFKTMLKYILDDGKRKSIPFPVSYNDLWNKIEGYSDSFKGIYEPVFVHYDLWDGNIFVSDIEGKPTIEGIIDFERGFYADPAADFSQISGYIDMEKDTYFLEEYNKYAQKPFILGQSEKDRIKLFRLYLYSIMIVESYYRDIDGSYQNQLEWATSEFIKLYNE